MLKFHSLTVAQVSADAEDAVAIALEVPEALRAEYRGSPGQHVVVRASIDGEETRRTYSLVSAPGEVPLRIVPRVHAQGRMSRHLAEDLRAGDLLEVLPPNGSFTPREASPQSASAFVAFAAGCGITPVLAVVRALLAGGAGRVMVFYGNTGTARTMCLEELLALKNRYLAAAVAAFRDEPRAAGSRAVQRPHRRGARARLCRDAVPSRGGERVFRLRSGRHDRAGRRRRCASSGSTRRACTPSTSRSRPRRQRSLAAAQRPRLRLPDAAEVTVRVDGRRRSFTMEIDDETVLDAAARAGIELPFSCRAGVCSTCRTKVISGEVEMAQNYALEDWELEQGYVLACQSRVKTRSLELDYDEK